MLAGAYLWRHLNAHRSDEYVVPEASDGDVTDTPRPARILLVEKAHPILSPDGFQLFRGRRHHLWGQASEVQRIIVSLRQNRVGTGFIRANAILPKEHCHSELFFEHYDPVNIAVWSTEMAGFSERFAVRRERIFAADVELFGFPFNH